MVLHIIDNTYNLAFSPGKKTKKQKNYDVILSKYDSTEKRYINYAYVLKNGVGRFNIFFKIYTNLAESSCVVFA